MRKQIEDKYKRLGFSFASRFGTRWLFFVLGLLGFCIRLSLILGDTWVNASDLRNYYWAGQQAALGNNPYSLWSQDISGPRSDLLPLELALLGVIVRFGKSPQAIRLFYLLVDLGVLGAIFCYLRHRPRQRLHWFALYAVGLGPLYYFTATPSDKPLILLLFVLIALTQDIGQRLSSYVSSALTGVLAALKWFGLFFALPLSLGNYRKTRTSLWAHMVVIGGV